MPVDARVGVLRVCARACVLPLFVWTVSFLFVFGIVYCAYLVWRLFAGILWVDFVFGGFFLGLCGKVYTVCASVICVWSPCDQLCTMVSENKMRTDEV